MGFWKFIASPVTAVIEGFVDIKKAKTKAKINQVKRGESSDITQDNQARGFAGWMDDISFYLFLLPLPLCFYPPAVPHIRAGFEVVKTMPEFWQIALGLMLASVWGYKRLITPIVTAAVTAYLKNKKL